MQRRVDVLEMKCLRTICGVKWLDQVSSESVREMCGNKMSVVEKAKEGKMKRFIYMDRMGEIRLKRRIYMSEMEGTKRMERPN